MNCPGADQRGSPGHQPGHAGLPAPGLDVLLQVVPRLDGLNQQLQANSLDPAWQKQMLDRWRKRNVLLGQGVNIICDGVTYRGTVVDIDPLHGLMLQLNTGALVHLPAATSTLQR
ncbi:MAG: hypothetical protein HC898_03845 [Phycisphaerales bacterium]|nr:hypothetical protein [Phycisphaerales bacterium]